MHSLLAAALVLSSFPSLSAVENPGARAAAQKGVNWLGRATAQWQRSNNCYGCHVQAVTLEGLAVGKHNQYEIDAADLKVVVEGMLQSGGGARTGPQGLTHGGFPRTAKTFGGAAFARYDQYFDRRLRDDLNKLARQLLEFQQKDGSVHGDHVSPPVTTGPMQATYQAMQTWRQVYTHSADDAWLAPIRRAENYIAITAKRWEGNPQGVYLQDVNYALMGMVAAGVSRSEDSAAKLTRFLISKQNPDGGWGFHGKSDPFATGQTVYALRLAGVGEQEPSVARGIRWLITHQKEDGSWGAAGSGKAEAMWAVLGLVSVDVVAVALQGIADGEHAAEMHTLEVEAKDNQGGAVKKVELFIDDVSVHAVRGGKLTYEWSTAALKDGKHVIDAVATNATGQQSRRRVEVYAGNVFLTSLASQFTAEGTQVSVRNIAAKDQQGTVTFRVLEETKKDGQAQPGQEVYKSKQPGAQGAMSFTWTGKGSDGKQKPAGRYFAELSYHDEKGTAVQTERVPFTHDTPENQKARYAEVSGQVGVGARGGLGSSNTLVELVDQAGRVVQRVWSNEDGNYRFKGVDEGRYKVRVRKDGFSPVEAPVQAAPAAESKASLSLH